MTASNPNARLEAFCDGVFAIAITLLVIDLRLPVKEVASDAELWRTLGGVMPAVFAFLLSFIVILITWVNHHASLKLVARTSAPWIYANGFLLLTVAVIPFPTSLLGGYVMTPHAGPAVVVYDAVLAVQAVAWVLLSTAAVRGGLCTGDDAAAQFRAMRRNGFVAMGLYALFAVMAVWLPVAIAAATTLTWIFWLALSYRARHD